MFGRSAGERGRHVIGDVERVREGRASATALRVRQAARSSSRAARPRRRSPSRTHGPRAAGARSSPPALATRDAHIKIYGIASDDERLLDAYIFVGARKVFYRSNRNGQDPKKMAFDADLPLRPGVNVVTIVARENPDTTTRRRSSSAATAPTASSWRRRRPTTISRDGLRRRRLTMRPPRQRRPRRDASQRARHVRTPIPRTPRACASRRARRASPRTCAKTAATSSTRDMARLRELVDAPRDLQPGDGRDRRDGRHRQRSCPECVTLVPERREERTTEGGLDVVGGGDEARRARSRSPRRQLKVSLFIAADPDQIRAANTRRRANRAPHGRIRARLRHAERARRARASPRGRTPRRRSGSKSPRATASRATTSARSSRSNRSSSSTSATR